MKSLFTVSLILIGAVCCYAGQTNLKILPPPEPARDVAGFEKTACVAVDSAVKICQGLTEDAATGAKIFIDNETERISEWASETFLGETADFQVLRGDLDGDERDEIVVANRTAVSNGMGVNFWTVAVLPFPSGFEKINPARFAAEDFNARANFVVRRDGAGFDILATGWQTLRLKNSKNQTALYFVGRWFGYRNNRLEPLARPVAARRYLASFERERLKNIDEKNDSYFALNAAATEQRRDEPLTEFVAKREIEATVESAVFETNAESGASVVRVSLKTKNGEEMSLSYAANRDESDETFDFIGDFRRKRLYPKSYLPPDLNVWLKGKNVKFVSYADPKDGATTERILWLTN